MHTILPYGVLFEAKNATDEEVKAVEQECDELIEQIKANKCD